MKNNCTTELAWLAYLERNMPQWLQKLEIWLLMRLTAKAFSEQAPTLRNCNAKEALVIYRTYTSQKLSHYAVEEWDEIRKNMYASSYKLGRLLSYLPGICSDERRKRLIVLLYRNIEITLDGNFPGDFYISHCFFSEIYTPQVCYVMSGLDNGIISGIFGKGSLRFYQRLTEGYEKCRGSFI